MSRKRRQTRVRRGPRQSRAWSRKVDTGFRKRPCSNKEAAEFLRADEPARRLHTFVWDGVLRCGVRLNAVESPRGGGSEIYVERFHTTPLDRGRFRRRRQRAAR